MTSRPRRPLSPSGLLPLVGLLVLVASLAASSSPLSGRRSTEPSDDGRTSETPSEDDEPIDFVRQIRPILSSRCFACHGPDANDREADLRLDLPDDALRDRGDSTIIVPGQPDRSELIARIESTDPSTKMPPPDSHLEVDAVEIALLRRWIEQGASWHRHWSFEPIVARDLPEVPGLSSDVDPIDRYIEATLARQGIVPAPPADRATWLRRVTLDLTGLPPTLEELDAFHADPSSDDVACATVVRRLLASSACAERLALDWLDAARYADTNGYSIDDHREMWLYRDWVIASFLERQPFDRFLVEQLAGDLLPGSTERQRLATAFLRNSMNTHEGGTIPEEYRIASIADKIDTVGKSMLGLTLECARCHDHKYDPITQRDYYRLAAFFDRTSESGTGAVNGNTEPTLRTTSPLIGPDERTRRLDARLASLCRNLTDGPNPALVESFRKRIEARREAYAAEPPAAVEPFSFPDASRGEPLPSWIWVERRDVPVVRLSRRFELAEAPVTARLFVTCDNEAELILDGNEVGRNEHWQRPTVLDLTDRLGPGEHRLEFVGSDWGDGSAAALVAVLRLEFADRVEWLVTDEQWEAQPAEAEADARQPASIRGTYGDAPWGQPHAAMSDSGPSAALLSALAKASHEWTDDDRSVTAEAIAAEDPEYAKLVANVREEIRVLKAERDAGLSSVMVMRDESSYRTTHVLERGEYDKPGEAVTAGIPEIFGSLPEGIDANRLALAEWIVSPENPLVPRVIVNRYWQLLFGTGLVRTSEDFGSQGEFPTHPELLDHLAAEFVADGWNVHRLLERIVLSRAYRRSSYVDPIQRERDPEARLLGRMPRHRLDAEVLRDSALAVSGLLDRTLGGPSDHPLQPDGLWREISHFGHPIPFTAQHQYPDHDAGVRRRSLYVFRKRTSPPPILTTFDATNRETCSVRRSRTNTPLQALAVMNEPLFVAAAGALANRAMHAAPDDRTRLSLAFRLATARVPDETELSILTRSLERARLRYRDRPEQAAALVGFGIAPPLAPLDPIESAAFTEVASLILNLDETLTRE